MQYVEQNAVADADDVSADDSEDEHTVDSIEDKEADVPVDYQQSGSISGKHFEVIVSCIGKSSLF